MGNKIRVYVDKNKCIGSTTCIYYAVQTFTLDSEGKSTVVNVDGNDINKIQEAVDSCPVSAITIEKDKQ
jgi:ferredoxin